MLNALALVLCWRRLHEKASRGVAWVCPPPAPLQLVCDLKNNNRVLGLHYLGPNAGEVTQVSAALHHQPGTDDRSWLCL